MRLFQRVAIAISASIMVLGLMATAASASTPPNKYGQQCYKNGWQTVVGTSGPFSSQSACVAYVNKGRVLYPATATLTSVTSGPEDGLGALIGNPQPRTAGGFTDPAMRFAVGGSQWVPSQPIHLTYTAATPLGYTYTDPTTYFTPGLPNSGTGSFSTFFQDNCFDSNNQLVSGNVSYTLDATDNVGQSAHASGLLNCDAIPATVLASTGPLGSGALPVQLHAYGAHFTPITPITLTYSVHGTLDGIGQLLNPFFFSTPTTDTVGGFTFDTTGNDGPFGGIANGDNCVYDTGGGAALQTTDLTFTMTASDGTYSATATGILKCSLLAP